MVKMTDYHLKPINYDDLKLILKWRNSERIKSLMYSDHQITWQEHYKWFEKVKKDPKTMVSVLYYKSNPIGVVSFTNINKVHARCEWGFYIGDEKAPKGSGTAMAILALNKIFDEVGVHKVYSEVIATNIASYRYHLKLGFETEGRLVDHVWKKEKYIDVIQMALFARNWQGVKQKLLKELEEK